MKFKIVMLSKPSAQIIYNLNIISELVNFKVDCGVDGVKHTNLFIYLISFQALLAFARSL